MARTSSSSLPFLLVLLLLPYYFCFLWALRFSWKIEWEPNKISLRFRLLYLLKASQPASQSGQRESWLRAIFVIHSSSPITVTEFMAQLNFADAHLIYTYRPKVFFFATFIFVLYTNLIWCQVSISCSRSYCHLLLLVWLELRQHRAPTTTKLRVKLIFN